MPFTYTAVLNTSTNTLGYDITTIRSFAGWAQNGASLANQKYELFVRKVGSTTYESLGTYEYSPFTNSSTAEAGATKMVLTANDGIIATGVDAVRFVVMNHGYNAADSAGSTVDGSVFQEFDVIGAPTAIPAIGVISLQGENTSADTNNTGPAGYAAVSAYSSQVSAVDLINNGSASRLSGAWDKTPNFESNSVTDGTGHPTNTSAGTFLPALFGTGNKMPFTHTTYLNLNEAPDGYRITEIRSFAGWNMNGATLANQKYQVLVSQVGNGGFYSLGTFEYSPFDNTTTKEAASTKVVLTADDGVLADRVDAIRFVVLSHGYDAPSGGADGSVFHEFDVFGRPTKDDFNEWALGLGIPQSETYDGADGDGIDALMEYALGLSPLVSEVIPAPVTNGAELQLTWPKGALAAVDSEISYVVQVSDNLEDWVEADAADIQETSSTITLTFDSVGDYRFGRLKVIRAAP